jgi:hypothetical protein
MPNRPRKDPDGSRRAEQKVTKVTKESPVRYLVDKGAELGDGVLMVADDL